MKFKEYIDMFIKLIKTKSLVVLKCPYCDSINIDYFKSTLEEKESEDNIRKIEYGIACKSCSSVALIKEYWNDSLREKEVE